MTSIPAKASEATVSEGGYALRPGKIFRQGLFFFPLFFFFIFLYVLFVSTRQWTMPSFQNNTLDSDASVVRDNNQGWDAGEYVRYAEQLIQWRHPGQWLTYFWPPGFPLLIAAVLKILGNSQYPLHMAYLGIMFWSFALFLWFHAIGAKWPYWMRLALLSALWSLPTVRTCLFGEGAVQSEPIGLAAFSCTLALLCLGLRTQRHLFFILMIFSLSACAYIRTVFDSIGFFALFFVVSFFGVKSFHELFFQLGKMALKRRSAVFFAIRDFSLLHVRNKAAYLLVLFGLVLLESLKPLSFWLMKRKWPTLSLSLEMLSTFRPSFLFHVYGIVAVLEETLLLSFFVYLIRLYRSRNDQPPTKKGSVSLVKFWFIKQTVSFRACLRTPSGQIFGWAVCLMAILFVLDLPWRLHNLIHFGAFRFGNVLSYWQAKFWWVPKYPGVWPVTSNTPCIISPDICESFRSSSTPFHPVGRALAGYLTLIHHPIKWFAIKLRYIDLLIFSTDAHTAFTTNLDKGLEGLVYLFLTLIEGIWFIRKKEENKHLVLALLWMGVFAQNFVLFTLGNFEIRYVFPLRVFILSIALTQMALTNPPGTQKKLLT